MANTWQGNFPHENLNSDGFARTSPVTAFPPNGYDIHDMIGNVWEWTSDWYSQKHEAMRRKPAAFRKIRAAARRRAATTPASRKSEFRAR